MKIVNFLCENINLSIYLSVYLSLYWFTYSSQVNRTSLRVERDKKITWNMEKLGTSCKIFSNVKTLSFSIVIKFWCSLDLVLLDLLALCPGFIEVNAKVPRTTCLIYDSLFVIFPFQIYSSVMLWNWSRQLPVTTWNKYVTSRFLKIPQRCLSMFRSVSSLIFLSEELCFRVIAL